jgi:phosphoribosylanthranilate isomerase
VKLFFKREVMIKVKICGITNYDDAVMAVKLGADALGFIFASSPRKISPEKARDIIRKLPPFIKSVGVFINEDPNKINEMIKYCGIDDVQLHGDESPELCKKYMPRTIKALRVKDESILKQVPLFMGKVKAFLLDTYSEKKAGGTGKIFDWDIALKIRDYDIPVILAGGLTPSNIEEAIQRVNPYAVDVNSGIEESPGKKSPALMKELFEKINYIKRRQKSECRSQE